MALRPEKIFVVASTTVIEDVNDSVRNCFDEYRIGVPDERMREYILRRLCSCSKSMPATFYYAKVARLTPGYVAGDLQKLVTRSFQSSFIRMCRRDTECMLHQNNI